VLAQGGERRPLTSELDRAFAAELRALAERATRWFDDFDQAHALMETESFFWTRFTDTFLELAKARGRSDDADARGSALAALRLGLSVLLRLLAPFQPYVTEEIWSWAFAEETGERSIHRAPWPSAVDFEGVAVPQDPGSLQVAIDALAAIHKAKADAAVSAGREVTQLALAAEPGTLARLAPVLADVLSAARVAAHRLEPRADQERGSFAVSEITFAERAEG
jgi:valyl-tRNA synthetase